MLQDVDISSVRVQVIATHHHHWQAMDSLDHDPQSSPSLKNAYHLWLVQDGCVQVTAAGKTWLIETGDACLLPIQLQRYIVTPQPTRWLSIALRITVFQKFNLLQNMELLTQWRPSDEEFRLMESWMLQIVKARLLHQPHYPLMAGGLAHALFGLCWPHIGQAPLDVSIHSGLPHWLAKVLQSIAVDPSRTITELAQESGFSPAQFRRLFHHHVGQSPRDYLADKRLAAACDLLEKTDLPLNDIAIRIGLRDATNFSRSFKSVYGHTPSQHRYLAASRTDEQNS